MKIPRSKRIFVKRSGGCGRKRKNNANDLTVVSHDNTNENSVQICSQGETFVFKNMANSARKKKITFQSVTAPDI